MDYTAPRTFGAETRTLKFSYQNILHYLQTLVNRFALFSCILVFLFFEINIFSFLNTLKEEHNRQYNKVEEATKELIAKLDSLYKNVENLIDKMQPLANKLGEENHDHPSNGWFAQGL